MTNRVIDASTGKRYICRILPCRGQDEVEVVLKEAYRIQVSCDVDYTCTPQSVAASCDQHIISWRISIFFCTDRLEGRLNAT